MSDSEIQMCRAKTTDGERCSRPARENGFCHQHDQNDPVVDENEGQNEKQSGDDESDQTASSENVLRIDESGASVIRKSLQEIIPDLIGRDLDAVIEITDDENGWQSVVEIIERSAVPDTQDIIGKYEVHINGDGSITGYRRLERYRRGDMGSDDSFE